MVVRISLLGERSIVDEATGAVRTRSARATALVAYLVLHAGAPQSRQHLAAVFWPDSSDAQALTNLRRELHTLRQVMHDEPALVVTASDLCWQDSPSAQVDVRSFAGERRAALAAARRQDASAALRHAEAALDHYAGELLPGMFDDWLLDARATLQRECVDLCALVCQIRVAMGDPAAALPAARRRIALEPLEETGYRVLMELQADLGDRAGALGTYHRCATVLERELGVAPGAMLRATLRRIMADEQPAEPPAARAGEPAPEGRLVAPGLVGRDHEFAVLGEAWRSAVAGRAGIVLVHGDPGAGKTRLVTELAGAVRRQGAAVASSQCFGASGRLALAPVAEWLRGADLVAARPGLDPVWREEVERLLPSAPPRPEAAATSLRAMVDAWQRHRFFEGLARALLVLDRPTLLVLDNLQWCDQETLAFLTFFLGLAAGSPVLVALTLRSDSLDGEPELARWIRRMRAADLVTEVTLAPLEAVDTGRLAESISGRTFTPEQQQLLQAATGGFPLHVVEAVRAVADGGTDPLPAGELPSREQPGAGLPVGGLTAVLHNRLEQSSPTAQEVAGLAAAVGRDFTLNLLVEASDLDADSVVRAVDELWRRRIVVERGEAYDFSHDLLRDAAYAEVSPPRRWLLHRRLAQSLELLHADDPDPVSAQLAEQYAKAGRPEKAVGYYRRAADIASGVFAHGEAVRLLSLALDIVRAQPRSRDAQRQELALLEATAAPLNALRGYSSKELQSVIEASVALAESLGRRDSLLNGLVGLWACYFVQGRVLESHAAAERALAIAEPGSDLRGAAHFALGGSCQALGRLTEAIRHLELAAASSHGPLLSIGTRPEIHASAYASHALWLLGRSDDGVAVGEAAVATARSLDDPYSVAIALSYLAVTHQLRADQASLRRVVPELHELCDRHGFAYYREWALVLDGWSRGGAPGLELIRRGVRNLQAEGSLARMPYWLSLLADAQERAGMPGAARSTLDAAVATAQARGEAWWLPEVQRVRAQYDDPEQAVARLRGAARLAADQGSVTLLQRCQEDLERALAQV